jgi:hypothetical protein
MDTMDTFLLTHNEFIEFIEFKMEGNNGRQKKGNRPATA